MGRFVFLLSECVGPVPGPTSGRCFGVRQWFLIISCYALFGWQLTHLLLYLAVTVSYLVALQSYKILLSVKGEVSH